MSNQQERPTPGMLIEAFANTAFMQQKGMQRILDLCDNAGREPYKVLNAVRDIAVKYHIPSGGTDEEDK